VLRADGSIPIPASGWTVEDNAKKTIFSFYLALTGYSVLRRKKPEDKAVAVDWCAAIVMVLAGGRLIASGVLATDQGERRVRFIFGIIGLLLGIIDIRHFFKPSLRDRAWWFVHMTHPIRVSSVFYLCKRYTSHLLIDFR